LCTHLVEGACALHGKNKNGDEPSEDVVEGIYLIVEPNILAYVNDSASNTCQSMYL